MALAYQWISPKIQAMGDAPQRTILSVEDNPDIANLIRLVLRKAPVEVLQAQTVPEAKLLLARKTADLLLLDMMLPGISGMEWLAELRSDGQYQALPVIIVSIRADQLYRRRAQELGVTRYLLKPFSPAVLRQEVEQALGVDWQQYWNRPVSGPLPPNGHS